MTEHDPHDLLSPVDRIADVLHAVGFGAERHALARRILRLAQAAGGASQPEGAVPTEPTDDLAARRPGALPAVCDDARRARDEARQHADALAALLRDVVSYPIRTADGLFRYGAFGAATHERLRIALADHDAWTERRDAD